jgi:hypothetical protein
MTEPLDGFQFDAQGLPIYPRDTLNSSPWLPERTILVVRAGSHAYGTSLPTSDRDYRGIAVSPKAYRDGFTKKFEQAEIKDPDVVIFELRKIFALMSDCNPNCLELVFVADEDVLLATEGGRLLREHRNEFLSKRAVHRFRGYAMAQLKRIRTHKKWLLEPPDHQPTREEFGLPQRTLIPADQLAAAAAEVKKVVDGWEVDYMGMSDSEIVYVQEQLHRHLTDIHVGKDEKCNIAARLLGYSTNFIELLEKERRYNAAQTNWVQYNEWKTNRNEKRSELEAKFGYDTKHAMHLVRLMRMCREILTTGEVLVKRPDAADLLAIRSGAWSYEKLIEWADFEDNDLQEVAKKSTLPRSPNMNRLDELCQEITRLMD